LRERLRALAHARRRFGYRRLFILLRRERESSGRNRIYRLYREEGLSVRKRRVRRRAVGTRAPILMVARANARWSVDFVHDQMMSGRRFRIFNAVDDVTRECLASIADTAISGARVAPELTALIERRGKLEMIVSDHGTEFTSNAMLIAPGEPMQNAFVESFNGRMRDELLLHYGASALNVGKSLILHCRRSAPCEMKSRATSVVPLMRGKNGPLRLNVADQIRTTEVVMGISIPWYC
jgi:transposase InsO family protein